MFKNPKNNVAKDDSKTSARIVAAAEELFAQRGFDAVSLRDITKLAEVNVASVSYHFGGKDALIEAVVLKHLAPINKQRDENLVQLRQKYAAAAIPLSEILHGFFSPIIHHLEDLGETASFSRFIGRVMGDGAMKMPDQVFDFYRKSVSGFIQEICKSNPGLTESTAIWHLNFTHGALMNTLLNRQGLHRLFGDKISNMELDELLAAIVSLGDASIKSAAKKVV